MKQFGAHLRAMREAKQMSQTKLSRVLYDRWGDDDGVSDATIGNWEGGKVDDIGAGALARVVVVLEGDIYDTFRRLVIAQGVFGDGPAPDAPPPSDTQPAPGPRRPRPGGKSGNGSKRRSS